MDLNQKHTENVRPWLDLIDTLRAQGVHEDLALPQIAVMGDQSSGKSSVLEAISGVPFPRGSGLVTRCPTQLTMKKTPPGTQWQATVSVSRRRTSNQGVTSVNNTTGKVVHDPKELTAHIQNLTERVTAGFGFSTDSIVVHVSSPDVPDLTLIDLPGIIRTHTSGQDAGVIDDVNDLIDDFLEQERTIILAVIPATVDVATVDILERAAQVDPTGERTIGVITKPDLIDSGGEDAVVEVLTNARKPLKLGYIMVKNRSQEEVAGDMLLEDALQAEAMFFKTHETFGSLHPSLFGFPNLTRKLIDLLVTRIKSVLPVMKFELLEMQAETNREVKQLGREAPKSPYDRMNALMKLIAEYSSHLRNAVRGDYRESLLANDPKLRLRTLLDRTFRILADRIRSTQPHFEAPDFSARLEMEIRGLRGRELPGLINSYFFYSFMVSKIEDWRAPVSSAKQELFDMIVAVSSDIFNQMCPQYPEISQLVMLILQSWAEKYIMDVDKRIEEAFKQEEDPFVANDDLAHEIVRVRVERFDKAIALVMKSVGTGEDASTEKDFKALEEAVEQSLGQWYMANHGVSAAALIEDMRTVLMAYWRLSSKRLTENVCMSFEAHVLQKLSDDIEGELLTAVQTRAAELVEELFHEPPEIVHKRHQLRTRKERLDNAVDTVNRHAPGITAVSRRTREQTEGPSAAARRRAQREARKARMNGAAAATAPNGAPHPSQPQNPQASQQGQPQAQARPPPGGDSALATFTFSGTNGDNNGYIYWLGTEGKRKKFENPHANNRIRVSSSGMMAGQESAVVSRKRGEVIVGPGDDVWLCMDVGRNRLFAPTFYTLCHGSPGGGYDLTSWALEGHDAEMGQWVDLSASGGPPRVLKSPHGVGTWPADSKGKGYRYVRIRSTGLNQRGDNSLPICAFEFYGTLLSA